MTLEHTGPDQLDDQVADQRLPALEPLVRGPRTAVSAAVARRLFRAAVGRLAVTVVEEPTGRRLGQGGPTMRIHRPDEFYARLGRDGLIGFGEAYLTGAWDAEDLAGFLTVPAARIATLVPDSLQKLRSFVVHRTPGHHRSTEANSQANISHHYDLSNDLFALFLDETLSYSAGLFDTSVTEQGTATQHLVATPPEPADLPGARVHNPDFAEAQVRKIERLLDQAGVGEGARVLEIGTGWGELAIRAARRGATVHSITLSVEQIEAVGHEFWGTYFQTIDRVLAPGGRVAIQAITMPHDRMLATRNTHTWINKYIFPGGFLPSVQVIDEITRAETTLRLVGRLDMGSHYAETLHRWDRRFLAQRDAVLALGFDDMFMRIWHFYLAYSQAGFASGYIDVQQLTLTRETS